MKFAVKRNYAVIAQQTNMTGSIMKNYVNNISLTNKWNYKNKKKQLFQV
jgi:hypothetical protein